MSEDLKKPLPEPHEPEALKGDSAAAQALARHRALEKRVSDLEAAVARERRISFRVRLFCWILLLLMLAPVFNAVLDFINDFTEAIASRR